MKATEQYFPGFSSNESEYENKNKGYEAWLLNGS